MYIKKISVLLVTIAILSIIFIPKSFGFSDIIKAGDNFINSPKTNQVIDEDQLEKVNSKIYNILLTCGIVAAVIVGAILGIYFIFASAEGKAKISETLVPYIIGCVVVFGAFSIWKIAINTGNSVESEVSVATGKIVKCECGYEFTETQKEKLDKGGKLKCSNCGKKYNY